MTWSDWKWQLQNRIEDLETLESQIQLSAEEKECFPRALEQFTFAVTPYYLSLADPNDVDCPIRKQVVPQSSELLHLPNEKEDPLAEEIHMPVKGVTHRYPDRAIWYLSHVCAVYCRFCTRKRKVSQPENTPNRKEWETALNYFQTHPEIREVILSGGDPLTLSDSSLDMILTSLKKIPHLNQVRIHTRHPVTLPMRFTDELCEILSKHFPIYIVTHFNHPKEITEDTKTYTERLIRKAGAILLNQSVLLRGINDNPQTLKELNYKLLAIGIKPYYLHQCDEVFGSSGFVVPIEEGIRIVKELRGFQSGLAIPNYVKDLTGGGGKVLLTPNSWKQKSEHGYIFENYNGDEYEIQH